MNNFKQIYFKEIISFFKNHSLHFDTTLDDNTIFTNINSIDNSDPDDLTFFHNTKYINKLNSTKAKACLIQKKYLSHLNHNCIPIILDNPYLAYALISNLINPIDKSNGQIHKSSLIFTDVEIDKNVQINANVIINNKSVR